MNGGPMGQAIYQVDAFTPKPFAGNPAAVCILPGPAEEGWMQAVAREMNLSETAFLHREGDGYRLRWFTPALEVDLCGHATLASAHLLWEEGQLEPSDVARFNTRSGLLTAIREGGWIELDFPSEPPQAAEAPPGLLQALNVQPTWVGRNRFDYLVEVDSEAIVRGLSPDFRVLKTVGTRGVMVTSPATTRGFDFVSRYFAPAAGIDEDPVTGSSFCCLTPFWAAKSGKRAFTSYQASARGGVVRSELAGKRVKISGQAVTVLRAQLV